MPGGFFSSLSKEAGKLGRDVSRGMDSFAKDVNKAVDGHWSSPILDAFASGNVLQLISRSSGKSLQIVQAASGQLVVDGLGLEGPTVYNAHWRILNHGKNVVSLQNQDNFLACLNGNLFIQRIPPGMPAGAETLFRLSQIDKTFVMLISKKEDNCRVGVLKDGTLKSPVGTGTEWDAQFGVRVVYTTAKVNVAGGVKRSTTSSQSSQQRSPPNRTSYQPTGATNQASGASSLPRGASAEPHGASPQPRRASAEPHGAGSLTAASAKEIEALGPRNTSENNTSQPHNINDSSSSGGRQPPMRPPPPYIVVAGAEAPPPYAMQSGNTQVPPPNPASSAPQPAAPSNPSYHSVPGNPAYPDVSN